VYVSLPGPPQQTLGVLASFSYFFLTFCFFVFLAFLFFFFFFCFFKRTICLLCGHTYFNVYVYIMERYHVIWERERKRKHIFFELPTNKPTNKTVEFQICTYDACSHLHLHTIQCTHENKRTERSTHDINTFFFPYLQKIFPLCTQTYTRTHISSFCLFSPPPPAFLFYFICGVRFSHKVRQWCIGTIEAPKLQRRVRLPVGATFCLMFYCWRKYNEIIIKNYRDTCLLPN
jgi:hypothetical protein